MPKADRPTGRGRAQAPERFGIPWSDQSVRLAVLGAAVVFILWLARGIIGPFVVAAVLAYAFSPVVTAVQDRTRVPRAAIIGIGYLLVFAVVGVLAFVAAERAGKELVDLSSGGRDVISSALHKLLGDTITVAGNQYNVDDLAAQIRQAFLGYINSPTSAVQTAEQAVDIGLQAVLCLIVTFYLLLDGHRFGTFALRFLDREQRADALRIARRIHTVLGRWLRGQLLLIILVAAVFYVILGPLLHVPYALALAMLSGVLEIVPLVGPIVAAVLAGTVTFARHGTDTTVVVLVAYLIVRQVEDQVVMPLVIGRAVHLHPVVTIFAVLLGLSTWGVLGGLLGVPVAAALNVTLRELYPEETGGNSGDEAGTEGRPATAATAREGGAVAIDAVDPAAGAGATDEYVAGAHVARADVSGAIVRDPEPQ
jgi:predicted PurR-regulated permease PerM